MSKNICKTKPQQVWRPKGLMLATKFRITVAFAIMIRLLYCKGTAQREYIQNRHLECLLKATMALVYLQKRILEKSI